MLDFSQEDEQKEYGPTGPVPSGSIVVVRMSVLSPSRDNQASEDPRFYVSKTGLRQLYCQFDVDRGEYEGVSWRQNITLPNGFQQIALSDNQKKAANIGGATIKAMLLASGRSRPVISDWQELNGIKFPVKVKINNYSRTKDGVTYWKNDIAMVITPAMDSYAQVRQAGELINKSGAVTGKEDSARPAQNSGGGFTGSESAQEYAVDDVPF